MYLEPKWQLANEFIAQGSCIKLNLVKILYTHPHKFSRITFRHKFCELFGNPFNHTFIERSMLKISELIFSVDVG